MYEAIDALLLSCGILSIFTQYMTHFEKILDRYATYNPKERVCKIKPITDKLKNAVYAAEKLGFYFYRSFVSVTDSSRNIKSEYMTIVAPTYRIINNLIKFFRSTVNFEYTTVVVLEKMVETFILYQLLETDFGPLLQCLDYEKINIFPGYVCDHKRALATLIISDKKIIYQPIDFNRQPTQDELVFTSVYGFVNNEVVQNHIFKRSIGVVKFSELSCTMVAKIITFVNSLRPLVITANRLRYYNDCPKLPSITLPNAKINENSEIAFEKMNTTEKKFVRAVIVFVFVYAMPTPLDELRYKIQSIIDKSPKKELLSYIEIIVDLTEEFYAGRLIILESTVQNRYYQQLMRDNCSTLVKIAHQEKEKDIDAEAAADGANIAATDDA